MPSKKPASAAQSKIFESGALILLLLMISGNGCCRERDAILRIEIKPQEMIGSHLVISAVLTAAALAGCFAYLVRPPIARVEGDQRPQLDKLTLGAPDAMASKGADSLPVENEKAAIAYLEAAKAILRRAPTAQASVSNDELPITGRIPLPKKRPIPRS